MKTDMKNHNVLNLAVAAAKNWLDGLEKNPVAATVDLKTLRDRIPHELEDEGHSPEEVIQHLLKITEGGLLGCAGGRFFGWVIGGAVPSALAADWLTSTWDQNAALYACGPAASVIEEAAGEWMKDLLDLPKESSFAFTTGCQLAHFTCLASARAAVLKKAGWDFNEEGLFGAPPVRVLTSEHRHGSVDRAVRYLGLGNKALQSLPTDAAGRAPASALKASLHSDKRPTILVLNAADLNVGAFDAFEELIPMAKDAGVWVHVDGAFGLFARASQQKRHLTRGVELADSWATDAHKWLNVPFDCGIAIVRDRQCHREAMTIHAAYIAAESNARDQIDWNPEWSRRARGIPVYAALRELGRSGVADLIDRTCRYGHTLVTEIGKLPGTQVLWEPQLNQGLVRFLDPDPIATDAHHNARTDSVVAAINATGEAFFSPTTWKGVRAMRVSVVNWRTREEDIQRAITAVRSVLIPGRAEPT
ncbi:MAG: aspartate aminotransferase family protein [Bdellovibrionales bacterium]